MNIYRLDLNGEEWFTEAPNAIEAVVKMYADAADDIEPDIKNADELTIGISLVQRNMTMEEFEQAHPDFFFT